MLLLIAAIAGYYAVLMSIDMLLLFSFLLPLGYTPRHRYNTFGAPKAANAWSTSSLI